MRKAEDPELTPKPKAKKAPARRRRKAKPKRKAAPRVKAVAAEPPFVKDPDKVRAIKALAEAGVPQEKIWRTVNITRATFEAHYREEWLDGHAMGDSKLHLSGMRMAIGAPAEFDANGNMTRKEIKPDTAMLIFLHKARLGFKETQRTELTGANGGAITVAQDFDLDLLTDDEFEIFCALRAKALIEQKAPGQIENSHAPREFKNITPGNVA